MVGEEVKLLEVTKDLAKSFEAGETLIIPRRGRGERRPLQPGQDLRGEGGRDLQLPAAAGQDRAARPGGHRGLRPQPRMVLRRRRPPQVSRDRGGQAQAEEAEGSFVPESVHGGFEEREEKR